MSPDDPRHGTHAGYQTHRRQKDTPCEDCKVAARKYRNEYRAKYGRWAKRCPGCGTPTESRQCINCRTLGKARPSDQIDFDVDPPRWVRQGLIWVAA